ncbi:MAG: hypothetical protein REI64_10670 [Pedobacter sp.]|uniref:hypothetical protein n=1 Tax=Pedobacter sp. TaxID=1411316 RepID=UPI0028084D29|nr:hypothetical protein [Pedobacter sp.]MDQ8005253.1 hypothetical protein [Pedobacter sp.]
MKTLIYYLNSQWKPLPIRFWHILSLSIIIWLAMPFIVSTLNLAIGLVDFGILHVVLLAFSCWLLALFSAYHIFRLLLSQMGMPAINQLTNHFNLLNLWEQYLIYVACYALLLCSAIGALIAIC